MLSLALLAAIAAQANDTPRERDLRCLAALSYATSTIAESERGGIIAGFMYYLGKLDARDPGLDLKVELTRLVADEAAFAKSLPGELKRCGGELEVRGAALKELGAVLTRKDPAAR